MKEDLLPKYVRFDPNYVSWNGLPYAVKEAAQFKVPIAVVYQEYADRIKQEFPDQEVIVLCS